MVRGHLLKPNKTKNHKNKNELLAAKNYQDQVDSTYSDYFLPHIQLAQLLRVD